MIDLSNWTKREAPGRTVLEGALVRLEPLDLAAHEAELFAAVGGDANAEIWTHMPVGPFATANRLREMLDRNRETEGWRTMVIRAPDRSANAPRTAAEIPGEILGMATYMRIREEHGSAEIGCVAFGRKLRRTPRATEALALMAGHIFDDMGYRRYEWKCNSENLASKRAAERFGFVFEGIFRNDMVTKGKSRDTAWYSITDTEWPRLKAALAAWLAPSNFGPDGVQITSLESFRLP